MHARFREITGIQCELSFKVTGGGNGLGRALCLELAKHGCLVAIADVDLDGAERTAQDLRRMGVKAKAYKVRTIFFRIWDKLKTTFYSKYGHILFQVDVSDYEQVQSLRENIEKDLGPVDILVNNAGLLTNVSLMEGTADEIQRVINVNLTAHLWVIK